jgi:GntR family transcriptional repressor for pyruvate dehydrogenase complex
VTPVSRPDPSPEGFATAGKASPFGGPKLQRQPISDQVASRILGMVKSGNLRPGDRLPTEAQMAVALGISRPPLREALKALTIMGVLESRQGGRYSVSDLSPSRLVAPFNAMLSAADYDIAEHFECRRIVDVELVRLCTRRATAEERARILRLAHDGQAFLSDPVGFRLLDYEYHQALNAGAHNAMLAAVALGLYDVALDARRVASAAPGVIPTSVRQHVEVAEAVVAGDEGAAAAAINRHLDHVLDSTLQSLAEMATSTPD